MRLVKLLFLITVFLVLIALGIWQVQRLQWKENLLTDLKTSFAAAPVALPAESVPPLYTHVAIDGVIAKDPLIVYRTGRFHAVVPVKMKDYVVLVDLGTAKDEKTIALQGKSVKGEGLIRYFSKGFFEPENNPPNGWYIIDGPSMEIHFNLPLAPFYVEALNSNIDTVHARNADEVLAGISNNHLSYAITWFGLALTYIVIVGIKMYKKK